MFTHVYFVHEKMMDTTVICQLTTSELILNLLKRSCGWQLYFHLGMILKTFRRNLLDVPLLREISAE